ncbi:MAG TPA: preprotein translocase subunit SecG [Phenylobacterium sp.]|uniref:preprotein translocase subunit SecG n=1 Tax=Phenylobacterium sp. TaxID=1871053 RepID=UPI002B914590|nr:preprotein translocase subunit SecG [Phenylobacterium sp.]HSV02167.1 preprotein translocase subunit SecG [Phenylobacterium sp.]
MLLNLLLIVEIIVSVLLVIVVLLQRSEGGVLGVGGGPSGFVTARGAGDLMTRMTWILATIFFVLALTLTLLAGRERGASSVVDRLKIDPINPTAVLPRPQPAQPQTGQPQPGAPQTAPAPFQAPAPTVHNPFLGEAPAPQTAPAPAAPAKP